MARNYDWPKFCTVLCVPCTLEASMVEQRKAMPTYTSRTLFRLLACSLHPQLIVVYQSLYSFDVSGGTIDWVQTLTVAAGGGVFDYSSFIAITADSTSVSTWEIYA